MNLSGLRDELGSTQEPHFDLTLPPGWTRRAVDEDTQRLVITKLRRRLMRDHNLEAFAKLKPMVEQSFTAMRNEGAFAFFAAEGDDPGTLWIPASINATVRRADAGETLDGLVRSLIRDHAAVPLQGDKRILRLERERVTRVGQETVVTSSLVYLTPIPGAGRRRALQLTAGFGRTVETSGDDPVIRATRLLFDACVSTLRWRSASRGDSAPSA